jgi:hypothetical protein
MDVTARRKIADAVLDPARQVITDSVAAYRTEFVKDRRGGAVGGARLRVVLNDWYFEVGQFFRKYANDPKFDQDEYARKAVAHLMVLLAKPNWIVADHEEKIAARAGVHFLKWLRFSLRADVTVPKWIAAIANAAKKTEGTTKDRFLEEIRAKWVIVPPPHAFQ